MSRTQNESTKVVWRDRLARFDRNDLTVKQFCRQEGMSDATFCHWRKRLQESDRTPSSL